MKVTKKAVVVKPKSPKMTAGSQGKALEAKQAAIERAEDQIAKSLPKPQKKAFAKVQAKEKKLEGRGKK